MSDLYIPFQFWFHRNTGLALPIIALQYNEVPINLAFYCKSENCKHFNFKKYKKIKLLDKRIQNIYELSKLNIYDIKYIEDFLSKIIIDFKYPYEFETYLIKYFKIRKIYIDIILNYLSKIEIINHVNKNNYNLSDISRNYINDNIKYDLSENEIERIENEMTLLERSKKYIFKLNLPRDIIKYIVLITENMIYE